MSIRLNNVTIQHSILRVEGGAGIGGSIFFDGSTYLEVAASSDFDIGNGDFTVEWFINQTNMNDWPRVFAFGAHPATLGVSIEDGTFYYWSGGSAAASMSTTYGSWNHMAVTRESGTVRLFVNGSMGAEVSYNDNFSLSSIPMTIGADPGDVAPTTITCNLTNFNFVVGQALYTAPFTPPTTPITASAGTKLLLLATDAGGLLYDSSTSHRTVSTVAGTPVWQSNNPF